MFLAFYILIATVHTVSYIPFPSDGAGREGRRERERENFESGELQAGRNADFCFPRALLASYGGAWSVSRKNCPGDRDAGNKVGRGHLSRCFRP